MTTISFLTPDVYNKDTPTHPGASPVSAEPPWDEDDSSDPEQGDDSSDISDSDDFVSDGSDPDPEYVPCHT